MSYYLNRRWFLKQLALLGSAAFIMPKELMAEWLWKHNWVKITILHTNDTHSRIDPFPDNDPKYPGLGGVVARSKMIDKIRSEEKNVLLLDSGDIFQGTPYFNLFGGKVELQAMSQMKYDAATIGNHDFDNGVEGLAKVLPYANFPLVCSNYDFTGTPLENKVEQFIVKQYDNIKVGIFGLGIELAGLVDPKLYGDTRYLDPLKKGYAMAKFLKKDLRCDLVICLSHLGFSYNFKKICDVDLAVMLQYIDIILGGHTHTFLKKGMRYRNKAGKEVIVNQVGFAGIQLGRIDVYFNLDMKAYKGLVSSEKVF
ncbi:MAG: metallophosphatase [Vicingaceae bacterium]|nr:MAG: metallophosphatase [Vicingaceae bacterium]